jgi:hypothetical protein
MCRYYVTSFACGHDLLEHTTTCRTRGNAGLFKHFPPCETTEPLRLDSGICSNCMAKHQEARVAARAVYARNNVLPRWKRRILVPLSNILENQFEAPAIIPATVSQKTPRFPLHRRGIRAGPPNLYLLKGRHRQRIPARGKATSTLDPKAIPSPVSEGEEPKSESGRSENLQRSWSTGDDLPWQSMPLQVERTVYHAQLVSDLDALPSQVHPLRQNPPEKIVLQSGVRVPPHLPRNETWEPQRSGRNVQKPRPNIERKPLPQAPVMRLAAELAGDTIYSAELDGSKNHQTNANLGSTKRGPPPASASELGRGAAERYEFEASTSALWYGPQGKPANIDRLSRAEQQDAELFFSQYDPKTLLALEAGSRAAKEAIRVPTVLRAGRPRPDSTYVSPTVGQIPSYYNTASEQKSSNRHAKLSTREEATWVDFILTHPTMPEMAATAVDLPPSLPQLTKLPALNLVEEVHLSSRISRPGLHDSYISSPKPPEELFASPASGKKRAKRGKTGNGKLQKKSRQVPRHSDGRPFRPEPECVWDEIVCKACVSLESLSMKSNASDSEVSL